MTEERLDALYEQLEDARSKLITSLDVIPHQFLSTVDSMARGPESLLQLAMKMNGKAALTNAVVTIARRCVVARDFNEFDPDKADMLWKLKFGGA